MTIASLPYEDRPAGITQAGAELLAHYEKLERERFPYFEEQFINSVGRQFFLIARIEGNGISEQVFVAYEKKQWGKYIGGIASQPTGRVPFKQGAKINLKRKDIHGWTIVNQDGTEEGFYRHMGATAYGQHTASMDDQPRFLPLMEKRFERD